MAEPVLVPMDEPGCFVFWCPGCCCAHGVDPRWTVTGTAERPTVYPSIKVEGPSRGDGANTTILCHLFVKDGQLRFLPDSTHPLAGKTIEMEPLP